MTAAEIAERLGKGRQKRSGTGWMVPCPSHADNTPSLWINDGDNGGVVLKCHAECSFEDIVAASGIARDEFFAERSDRDFDDLWTPKGVAIDRYPYRDETGRLCYTVMRLPNKVFIQWRPDATAPHGRAWNLNGVPRLVYRLPEVLAGIQAGRTIVICEGERDVHTLVRNGFVATCNSGGAGKFLPEFAEWFRGAKVVVLPDQDSPGKAHAEQVATMLHEVTAELRVIDLPGLTGEKGSKDATDWFEAGNDPADFKRIVRAADQWKPVKEALLIRSNGSLNDSQEWDDPRPLPTYRQVAPFCSGVLGDVATEMARAVSLDTKTPVDFASVAALGTCSSVIGGAVVVEVHETWHQHINLYLNLLAAPGSGKSPVMSRITHPLDLVEQARRERMEPVVREAEARRRVLEAQLKDREGRAAKKDATPQEAQDALVAANELAQLVVPARPRVYTRDATPEALVALLAEQGGRFAFVTDEGSEFYELAARYASTGKGNLGVYIDGKDGKRHVADRKNSGTTVIDRTTLTVCLFGQPIILESLAQDRQAKGRGLLARFLWSIPSSTVGWESTDEHPIPRHQIKAWESLIVSLAEQAESVTEPVVLKMSPDAKRRYDRWYKEHRPRLRANVGDLAPIVEWASKLDGELLRLAANLHALRTGSIHGVISDETMLSAIALADYFTDHALAVFGEMETPQAAKDAASILRWLEARSLSRTTTREIGTSKDWDAARTRDALGVLAFYGWVRPVVQDPNRSGRPSEPWDVHPKVTAQNGAEAPTAEGIAPFCAVDAEDEQTNRLGALRARIDGLDPHSEAAEICALYPDLNALEPDMLDTLEAVLDEEGVA